MTKYRNQKVYNAAGEVAHTRKVAVNEHRIRFGKASWDNPLPVDALNRRTVTLDGEEIGTLYGTEPSPSNANRPTAFRFIATGGGWMSNHSRLEEARGEIEREADARKQANA